MISPNSDLLPACAAPEELDRPVSRENRAANPSNRNAAADELTQIVRAAEAGDAAAQTELVRLYTRRVTGFVRGIICQPDAIEDVTQMVFIKMFRRLSCLRDPAVFESWLFTLARNTSLDFLRRRR